MKNRINILGTDYKIIKKEYDKKIFENIDGYTNFYSKEIIYCDLYTRPDTDFSRLPTDIDDQMKHVIRHEIVHAFLNESGLVFSTNEFRGQWSSNEEMVDWIAITSPKMFKVFKELDIFPNEILQEDGD